jgi:hypothetical protein
MLDEDEAFLSIEPYSSVMAYVWVVGERCLVVAQNRDEALLMAHAIGVRDVSRKTPVRRAFQADVDRLPTALDVVRQVGDPLPA